MVFFNDLFLLVGVSIVALILFSIIVFLYFCFFKNTNSDENSIVKESSVRKPRKSLFIFSWFRVLKAPLVVLAFLFSIYILSFIFPWTELGFDLKNVTLYQKKFLQTIIVIIFFWIISNIITRWEYHVLSKDSKLDNDVESTIHLIFQVVKFFLYFCIGAVLLSIFDLKDLANNLFTAGAVSTVFIGLASRDAMANFFAGLMILVDRPFKIKDYIRSEEKDIEGTIEQIGWRITQVRTPTRRIKYIPNSLFSTIPIENITRMSARRIRFNIGLRYCDMDKVKLICDKIEESFENTLFIDKRQANFATFSSLGDYSLIIMVNVYAKPMSFREYNKSIEELLHTVVKTVKKNKADFAFPTTTLDADNWVKTMASRIKEDGID